MARCICRNVLVQETVNLLKLLGAEPGQDVLLKEMLFLYQRKGNVTETVVCDRIAYNDERGGKPFYTVCIDGDRMFKLSSFLSIDSLLAIYEAVRKVVREE